MRVCVLCGQQEPGALGMRLLRAVGVCVCAAVAADGHAAMNRPLPRTSTSNQKVWPTNASTMLHPGCAGGSCMYYSIGCLIGCECTGKGPVGVGYGADPHNSSSVGCESLMEPTLNDPKLRTWNIKGKSERGEWTKYNPWRAPGHCKPLDPCGMYWGRDNITDLRPPGTPSPGSEFPPLGGAPERWTAGETATVAFSMVVNRECRFPTAFSLAAHSLTLATLLAAGSQMVVGTSGDFARSTILSPKSAFSLIHFRSPRTRTCCTGSPASELMSQSRPQKFPPGLTLLGLRGGAYRFQLRAVTTDLAVSRLAQPKHAQRVLSRATCTTTTIRRNFSPRSLACLATPSTRGFASASLTLCRSHANLASIYWASGTTASSLIKCGTRARISRW